MVSCKKESDDEIREGDYVSIQCDSNTLHADTSYFFDEFSGYGSGGYENLTGFGFYYCFNSNSGLLIIFELYHKAEDLKLTCGTFNHYKLNDMTFYSIFHEGSYEYRSSNVINDLTLYVPVVFVSMTKEGVEYTNLRYKNNKWSSYSMNRFTVNNFNITKEITNWSDCDNLKREVRIKGNFDCYLYHIDRITYEIDSIKVTCTGFVGTIVDH